MISYQKMCRSGVSHMRLFTSTHLVLRCEKLREFAALSKQACMRQHDSTVQFASYRLIVKLDQECGGMDFACVRPRNANWQFSWAQEFPCVPAYFNH